MAGNSTTKDLFKGKSALMSKSGKITVAAHGLASLRIKLMLKALFSGDEI